MGLGHPVPGPVRRWNTSRAGPVSVRAGQPPCPYRRPALLRYTGSAGEASDARLRIDPMGSATDPSPDLRSRFEALVVPHLDRLLAFAIRRSDSVADAEDAVQEAFVRAWLGFADLRDDALARPWIYRILRTVISDFREKNGRRQQLVFITRLEDAHDELIGGEHDALFSEVVARLDSEAIHRALLKIPEDFATAVELHDIDGFKYAEIAEIVAVPIGTVMSRIARGRKLLAGAVMAERGAAAEQRSGDLGERRAMRGGPR